MSSGRARRSRARAGRVPVHQRVDRALGVEQRRLRGRPVQCDLSEPVAVALGPRRPVVEPDPVTQQQLREPVPQRIRSTRTASRARTRSRSASSSRPGTRTACSFPASNNLTSSSASRRSVLTRSPGARGILLGAATTHSTRRFASSRASPYPVGPASYATRTGLGTRAQNAAASPASPFIRNVRNSPLSASSTAATIFVACTSKPTRVLAFAMAGSSYSVVDRPRGGYRAA